MHYSLKWAKYIAKSWGKGLSGFSFVSLCLNRNAVSRFRSKASSGNTGSLKVREEGFMSMDIDLDSKMSSTGRLVMTIVGSEQLECLYPEMRLCQAIVCGDDDEPLPYLCQ